MEISDKFAHYNFQLIVVVGTYMMISCDCCGDGSIVKGDGDVLLMWLLVVDVFFEVLIDKSTTMFMYIYSV